jgi:hypothetical protein
LKKALPSKTYKHTQAEDGKLVRHRKNKGTDKAFCLHCFDFLYGMPGEGGVQLAFRESEKSVFLGGGNDASSFYVQFLVSRAEHHV